jgi:hypothetical protein
MTARKQTQPDDIITQADFEKFPWLRYMVSKITLTTWTDVATFLDVAMSTFRNSLVEARRKLELAQAERDALNVRIANLERLVETLAAECDSEVQDAMRTDKPLAAENSFNNAIEFALRGAKIGLTPVEVRDKMEALGYDFSKYESDPLASIHTLLKRFVKKGLVTVNRLPHNRTEYKWAGDSNKAGRESAYAAATNNQR